MTVVPPDDPRIPLCGFARIVSPPGAVFRVDAVLRARSVVLGRQSKSGEADVVLSDHLAVSRHHAVIRYVPSPSPPHWELVVLGKNGVSVSGELVGPTPGGADAPPGAGRALASHDVLTVGDTFTANVADVEFLLPAEGAPQLRVGGGEAKG